MTLRELAEQVLQQDESDSAKKLAMAILIFKKALKFYADKNNYHAGCPIVLDRKLIINNKEVLEYKNDNGEIAKQTIKQAGKIVGEK